MVTPGVVPRRRDPGSLALRGSAGTGGRERGNGGRGSVVTKVTV